MHVPTSNQFCMQLFSAPDRISHSLRILSMGIPAGCRPAEFVASGMCGIFAGNESDSSFSMRLFVQILENNCPT